MSVINDVNAAFVYGRTWKLYCILLRVVPRGVPLFSAMRAGV